MAEEWTWWWGFGSQPERYEGDCATRDQALATALEAAADSGERWEAVMVCEGRRWPLSDSCFDADRVLEEWHDHNEDAQDEDGELGMAPTAEQKVELEADLAKALAAWRARHSLGRAWALDTRKEEVIRMPQKTAADGE